MQILQKKYQKMLLNKSEASNEIGVSQATLDRLRKYGQIKSKKILGQVMFDIGEVVRFMDEA